MAAPTGAAHLKSTIRRKIMDSVSRALLIAGGESIAPPGQIVYEGSTTPGDNVSTTYSFVVPAGVTSISVVCVGAGGGGGYNLTQNNSFNCGGSGGGLAWANNISVTPGETLEVIAGRPGVFGFVNGAPGMGGPSHIRRVSTNTIFARALGGEQPVGGGGTKPPGGTVVNGTGGTGGRGNQGITNGGPGGGAGGAAGYTGNGGNGRGVISPTDATAGAGGGGGGGYYGGSYQGGPPYYQDWQNGGGGGGGVELLGQGSNGAAGVIGSFNTSGGGGGGSGGANGTNSGSANGGSGGKYGGGGGGGGFYSEYNPDLGETQTYPQPGANGGLGAVRIIWPGDTRQFPSTNTGNV